MSRQVLIRTNFHRSVRFELTDQFCRAVLAVAAARDVLFNAHPAIVGNWRYDETIIDVSSEYYSFWSLDIDPKHISAIYPGVDLTLPIVLLPKDFTYEEYKSNLTKAVGLPPKDGPGFDSVSVRRTFYFRVNSAGRMFLSDEKDKGIYMQRVPIESLVEIIKRLQPVADIGY